MRLLLTGCLLLLISCKTTQPSSEISTTDGVGDTKYCDEVSKRARTDKEVAKMLVEMLHTQPELRSAVAICLGGLLSGSTSETPATDAQAKVGVGQEELLIKSFADTGSIEKLLDLAYESYKGKSAEETVEKVTAGLLTFKMGQAAINGLVSTQVDEVDVALSTLADRFVDAIVTRNAKSPNAAKDPSLEALVKIREAINILEQGLKASNVEQINAGLERLIAATSSEFVNVASKQNLAVLGAQIVAYYEFKNPDAVASEATNGNIKKLAELARFTEDAGQFFDQARIVSAEVIKNVAETANSSPDAQEVTKANFNRLAVNANTVATRATGRITNQQVAAPMSIAALVQRSANRANASASIFSSLAASARQSMNTSRSVAAKKMAGL